VTHGTSYAYREGCRCAACRKVENAKRRQYRARLRQEGIPAHVHGKTTGYGYGCRCQPCRDAQTAYWFAYTAAKAVVVSA
jgi:hypothetical protein